jgi:predicted DNA binding CopG/RHH family protein
MPKIDPYEKEVLEAFEQGALKSVATKEELARIKEAARATAIKDRRVNIRLSSGDLSDIQARALEEGVPYQTLIASVLHKYVTGRLAERATASAPERRKTVNKGAKTGESAKKGTASQNPAGVRARTTPGTGKPVEG